MLGRVTVPILPYRRRDGYSQPVQRGAVVTVYNAMADNAAAVNDSGVVATGATTATVYRNANGSTIMQNPYTCDEFGGPDDDGQPGVQQANFSFFGFPGTYHLRVVATDGSAFGIPFVRLGQGPRARSRRPGIDTAALASTKSSGNWTGAVSNTALSNISYTLDSPIPAEASGGSILQELLVNKGTTDPFGANPNESSTGTWGRIQTVEIVMEPTTPQAGVTAGMVGAFGIGQYSGDQGGTWTVETTTASGEALAMLYIKWSVPEWRLYLSKGDGATAATDVALTGVPTPTISRYFPCRLLFNPNAGVLQGEVCGQIGATIVAPGSMPSKTSTSLLCGLVFFILGGTSASEDIKCRFHYPIVTTFS